MAAKKRQAQAGGSAPGKLPEAVTAGTSRDKSSRGTGYGARTLDKAAEIVEAAEAEPEKYAKLGSRHGKRDKMYPLFCPPTGIYQVPNTCHDTPRMGVTSPLGEDPSGSRVTRRHPGSIPPAKIDLDRALGQGE